MIRLLMGSIACAWLFSVPAIAQFTDAFSDGDLTRNPAWAGPLDRWTVTPLDGDPALRVDGAPASDTLFLATPSAVSRGTWSFTFAYRGVNLSNFNGVRLFLMADTDTITGPVHGYYVQLGASNTDEVRLYRQDGAPATRRSLLGRSTAPLLTGDDQTMQVSVTRSATSMWEVSINASPVITVMDSTYTTSRFFGLWLKHTPAAAQHFFFDDFVVQGQAGPPDTAPPYPTAVEALDAVRLAVTFNEAVDGCFTDRYEISNGIGLPVTLTPCPSEPHPTYVLRLARALVHGTAYQLTVRDLADRTGNVLSEGSIPFLFIDPDSPPPAAGDLVINEIHYAPPDPALEFVELFNRSDSVFDLRLLSLADDRFAPVPVPDAPYALHPGAYAVLVRNGATFRTAFPGVAFVELDDWPTLNNGGDTVVLFFEDTVLDAIPYESAWGGEGVSLERKDPAGPSNTRFNFGASQHEAGATPGAPNSILAPDRTPPAVHFAEQVGDRAVDLYLDEPIAPASAHPAALTLDDGRAPRSLFLDQEATRVRLRFEAMPTGTHLTVGGLRDLTGNTLPPTRIALAYRAQPGDLIIHEIMYDPLADPFDHRPDQPEYVELRNQSKQALTLRHHYWTTRPDESGIADTLRFGEGFYALRPYAMAVVFASVDATADPARDSPLAQAFPDIDFAAQDILLIPLPRATLRLSNSGALIYLHRPDDLGLDSVFYHLDWHHPNLEEATGVALERILPDGRANDPGNWTSSVADAGGTPGQPNSTRLPDQPDTPEHPLLITPSPFSPDRDGIDDVAEIRYRLPHTASLVRVRIFDARGRLVRTLEAAHLTAPTGRLLWDGLDDQDRMLRPGIYVVLFEALDTKGGINRVYKAPVVLARRLG